MARQIDQREQEIAGFLGEFPGVAAIERGLDLVGLLADLVQHCAGIVPVEADAGGLALQFHRARQRRLSRLDAGQQRFVRILLGGRRAARSAFSSALMRSHALVTPTGVNRPSSSANTCGCRRIILRVIASTTSPNANAFCSSAMRA